MTKTIEEQIGLNIKNLNKESSKELQAIAKLMAENNKKSDEFLAVSQKILAVASKGEYTDPYSKLVAEDMQKRAAQNTDINYYKDLYGDESLALNAWKQAEERKISNNSVSDEEKAYQYMSLNELFSQRNADINTKSNMAKGEEIGNIMSKTLNNMITDFDNFDKHMKNMSNQLLSYLLDQTMNTLFKGLLSSGGENSIMSMLTNGSKKGGLVGGLASVGAGIFKNLKLHSGGVVPSGASYSLPGTQEQLAILKGGERVLSPGENAQYESSSGSPTLNVVNFHVKAWDSKDVSKYLLENKQLINQITFQGIKDNNCNLRTIVKNV